MKITALPIAVQLFLFKNIHSQNLIQNSSFELYDSIDCNSGGFDNYYLVTSPHVLNNWYGYQSPDYFNSVCNPGGFNVPNSYFGYSNAKHGSAFIGIVTYLKGSYLKEYIYQQLAQPLQSGNSYCLSFYVSRADRFPYAIKNIGALFTLNTPTLSNCCEINANAQVVNVSSYISDTTGWTQIQGCFTANGGEQYITIGNFSANANTDTLYAGTNNLIPNGQDESYYYIDDIQLWDALTTDLESLDGTTLSVYPNPVNDVLHFEFGHEALNREVKLYDAIGNLVLTTELSQNKTSLNISGLPNGVYFYSILVGEKTIKTDKVVIIK